MHKPLAVKKPHLHRAAAIARWVLLSKFGEKFGYSMHRSSPEALAVIGVQEAKGGAAQSHRLFEHRVEDRGQIAGRGVDDLQYFGDPGFSVQRRVERGFGFSELAPDSAFRGRPVTARRVADPAAGRLFRRLPRSRPRRRGPGSAESGRKGTSARLLREPRHCSVSVGTAVQITGTAPPHELGRFPHLL